MNMGAQSQKEEYEEAAIELEAAAGMIDPYLRRLDDFIEYINANSDWLHHPIPQVHHIVDDDVWNVYQSAEHTFLRYLHLYPNARDEWISGTLAEFKMTTVKGTRSFLGKNSSVLRKYAAYARTKANLPPPGPGKPDTTYHIYGGTFMRDQYKDFTAAAVGPQATAINTNIQIWKNAASELDLPKLAADLSSLHAKLRSEPDSAEHDEEIGQVAAAERAAKNGDGEKTLHYLKGAGKWVLDVASKITESVAAKALLIATGLPAGGD
jgi:tetratricopeptide (TPR) repeat protein